MKKKRYQKIEKLKHKSVTKSGDNIPHNLYGFIIKTEDIFGFNDDVKTEDIDHIEVKDTPKLLGDGN